MAKCCPKCGRPIPEFFGLTKKQKQALGFIADYMSRHDGIAPSYQEIAEALGLKSKSGVHRIVQGLTDKGHIRSRSYRARSITLNPPPDTRDYTSKLMGDPPSWRSALGE
jgi:repressor LexA